MQTRPLYSLLCLLSFFGVGCQLILVPEEKPATRFELVSWGTNREDTGQALALDASGHIFVSGGTRAGMDGQPYLGMSDVFFTHLNSSGSLLGTIQFGTAKDDIGWAVAVDGGGAIFVAGGTTGTFPGQTSAGGQDAFLAKFESNGSQAWVRQFGTAGEDAAYSVAVDHLGNSYVVGYTTGALNGQTHAGDRDAILLKYSGNGNLMWTKQWGTSSGEEISAISIDALGNLFVTGQTTGALDGQVARGSGDLFLSRLSSTGQKIWTRQVGTPYADAGLVVAPDNEGNVFVAGFVGASFNGNVFFGGLDAVVLRFSAEGDLHWSKQFGSSDDDIASGVAVGANRRVTVVGTATGALDGQQAFGGTDVFIRQFDSGGVELWTQQLGSTGDDRAMGVVTDAKGRIYLSGSFAGNFEGLQPQGETDVFLLFSE